MLKLEKLHIENMHLIEITKIKPWSIDFKYDGTRYLLHESDEDYESSVTLYRKEVDENGRYELFVLGRHIGSLNGYIGFRKRSAAYKHINKERFIKSLVKYGLSSGAYEREYAMYMEASKWLNKSIKALEEQKQLLDNEFWGR